MNGNAPAGADEHPLCPWHSRRHQAEREYDPEDESDDEEEIAEDDHL